MRKDVFHRDILRDQFQDLFEQLVNNGDLNTEVPITGRSDQWGQFFWGSPDYYQEDWQSPVIFVYDFEVLEEAEGLDLDRVIINVILGVAIGCTAYRGNQRPFDNLWWKIQRFWGKNAPAMPLEGTSYILKDLEGNPTTFSGQVRLGNLGIVKAQMLGSIPRISDGKIDRYQGQLQIELFFNTAPPMIGNQVAIT